MSEIELNLQTVSSSGASAKSEVDKLKKEINSMKESRDSDKQVSIDIEILLFIQTTKYDQKKIVEWTP